MIVKKFISGMLVGGMITGILSATTVVLADSNIQAILWPATVSFNVKGTQSTINEGEILNYNNKAYVPLRSFAESMGAKLIYTQPAFSGDKHKVDIVFGDEKTSVNITDNGVKDILNELIPKAVDIYGMFNGAGYFKIDATKTIPGEQNYSLVTGVNGKHANDTTNVKSIADLKKVIEDVFTTDTAQKLFYSRYLTPEKDSPFYKDYEGNLYEDMNHGGHGWAEKFLIDTAKIKSQKDNVVVIELDTTVLDTPGDKLTISIVYVNGKWLLASPLV
jgi:hypothetical protein